MWWCFLFLLCFDRHLGKSGFLATCGVLFDETRLRGFVQNLLDLREHFLGGGCIFISD